MAYDIAEVFEEIEMALIKSMRNNMKRHINEEYEYGLNWTQWQAEMLSGLSQYRAENKELLKGYMGRINAEIDDAIREAYATGESEQEIELLKAIKKGYKPPKSGKSIDVQGGFFRTNARKLNALIKATTDDMKKAETAMLRMTDDVYRKTMFKAQMFYNTGAGSMWQCVDMATKDFLSAGINCVQYKNGARVNIASYAEMSLKTANKRANLMGQAMTREKWGIHTVKVNARGTACPMCMPYLGKVFIDDVYGEGTAAESRATGYPLLSKAVANGLFHPNCKDACSTYYEGINREPQELTQEQEEEIKRRYNLEQMQRYYERNYKRNMRLGNGCLDQIEAQKYFGRATAYKSKLIELVDANSDVLRYDKQRLSLRGVLSVDNAGRISVSGMPKPRPIRTIEQSNEILANALMKQYNHRIEDLGLNYIAYDDMDEVYKGEFKKGLAKLKGMDDKLADATAEQLSKLISEYETMLMGVNVGIIEPSSALAGTTIAMNTASSNMKFNWRVVNDYDKFMERMEKAVQKGQFPSIPRSQYDKYMVTHEFVHTLFDMDSKMRNSMNLDTKNIAKARKEIKELRVKYNERLMELEVAYRQAERKALTTFEQSDWDKSQELQEEIKRTRISKYADESADEFMAEGFADALLSDNPSPYSLKILEIINKYFKK